MAIKRYRPEVFEEKTPTVTEKDDPDRMSTSQVSIDERGYFDTRVEPQIRFYVNNSEWSALTYWFLQTSQICMSASIPLLLSGVFGTDFRYFAEATVAVFGVDISIFASINTIGSFHKTWLTFRNTAELMKNHKNLYITGSEPYNKAGAFQKFVKKFEELDEQATKNWVTSLLTSAVRHS